jgi:hypothetical protein
MKRAVLIGINYFNTYAELYGCINDAVAIKNTLIDAYGYDKDNITVLRDDDQDNIPSCENIINVLENIANESDNLNELWIHYSGHGTYIRDDNNEELDRRDEAIVPCDFLKNGIIKDDRLRLILNNVKCKTFITMDCCHAGSSWDIQYKFPIYNNSIYRNIENYNECKNKNIYMIAGSRDNQYAGDYFNFESRTPMGVFTMYLIETMRELNHNYSILKLYIETNKKIKSNGFSQTCILSSTNSTPFTSIRRNNNDYKIETVLSDGLDAGTKSTVDKQKTETSNITQKEIATRNFVKNLLEF